MAAELRVTMTVTFKVETDTGEDETARIVKALEEQRESGGLLVGLEVALLDSGRLGLASVAKGIGWLDANTPIYVTGLVEVDAEEINSVRAS